MSNYDELLDMYNDAFNDSVELEEVDQEEVTQEEVTQEEVTQEEVNQEEVTQEEASQESNLAESTMEITGEVQVINFDSWDTPLNSCSAVTISVLIILFFLALASIGGVLND